MVRFSIANSRPHRIAVGTGTWTLGVMCPQPVETLDDPINGLPEPNDRYHIYDRTHGRIIPSYGTGAKIHNC